MAFFATIALTGVLFVADPEGLLPDPGHRPDHRHHGSRAGRLAGRDEAAAAQGRDRARRRIPTSRHSASFFGSGSGNTLNTARFFIGLKPHEQRSASAHADHRAAAPADRQARRRQRCSCSRRRTSRSADASRAANISTPCRTRASSELNTWAPKMLEKFKTLPRARRRLDRPAVERAAALDHASTATPRRASASSRR